jgi:hypothetical protein
MSEIAFFAICGDCGSIDSYLAPQMDRQSNVRVWNFGRIWHATCDGATCPAGVGKYTLVLSECGSSKGLVTCV